MSRSKKIFFVALGIFFLIIAYVSYDISQRTSFPGSKSQLKERLKEKYAGQDTLPDTLKTKK
jgi:hypothetical protein